jgi:acyl carrier protein
MDVAATIERFLRDEILYGEDRGLDRQSSLIASGVLDSVSLLLLVQFLESTYGLTIGDDDLVPENFETLERIVAFVGRRAG